jgi:hypothetical protein
MRRLLALLLPLLAVLAAAPVAGAALLPPQATSCAAESLSPVFDPWLDPADYTLAPGGGFEDASGWTGGTTVSGNERFHVHAAGDGRALRVFDGQSATSPTVCVGIDHPTLRFFARSTGAPLGLLRVDVSFWGPLGIPLRLPIGVVAATAHWEPSLPLVIPASLLPLLPGRMTPVTFHLVPVGAEAAFDVDDVYVDPYKKG